MYGLVASDPTVSRTIDALAIDARRALAAITATQGGSGQAQVGCRGGGSRRSGRERPRRRDIEGSLMATVSRGFGGRRQEPTGSDLAARTPPGQYLTDGFPVLSADPTPRVRLEDWTFQITGGRQPISWTWQQFRQLPSEPFIRDIHCVTR